MKRKCLTVVKLCGVKKNKEEQNNLILSIKHGGGGTMICFYLYLFISECLVILQYLFVNNKTTRIKWSFEYLMFN